MDKKPLLLLILISLSSLAWGDGFVLILTYDEYGVERDTLLSGEDSQVSVVDYRDGIEDMLISVKVTPGGEGMLWIFPVPADPEKCEIDITSEFPEMEGYNIKNKLGGKIKEVGGWSLISQLWSFFPACITNPDLIKREFFHAHKAPPSYDTGIERKAGGGFELYLDEPDYGVRVYHRINKLGLTSELLTARHKEGLRRYLAEKNLTLPQFVMDEIDWYIGGDYAFVVSWVSNPEEFGGQKKDLALRVRFPTNKIYYPLKLTSVYGSQVVPITIYFNGYVNPQIYDPIKQDSETEYFISTDYKISSELDSFFGGHERTGVLKYTRLSINTESHNLKQDLWVSTSPPLSVIFADLGLALPSPLFELLLFAGFSCLASLLAGWVIFGKEIKPLHLIILGLSNFTSLLGVYLASNKLLLKDEAGEKFPKRCILFFIPLILVLILLILLKIIDTGWGLVIFGIISIFSLLILLYFLSTISLISFSFVKKPANRNPALYLAVLFALLLLAFLSLLFIIGIFLASFSNWTLYSGSILYEIVHFVMPVLYLSLGFLTLSTLLIYLLSTIYLIYLLYSALHGNTLPLNHRVFYSGALLNLLVMLLLLAKFMAGLEFINLWVLILILPPVLIYLSSTTSLWYFILIRKELKPHHCVFLFVILFSIFFALISLFSTEMLMLEYHPL